MVEKALDGVLVANMSELPTDLGTTVYVGDQEIALFKLATGEIRAIENRCPHKNGVLAEGMVSGNHVFCPMHDWKINTADGRVQAPDTGCVKTFKVEVKNDDVFIVLD